MIVDFKVGREAQRAPQIAFVLRDPDAMVVGQSLHRARAQPVDAGVANMQDVRGGGLQHHHGHGADVAPVGVARLVGVMALARLRVQPAIGRA
ncbi:hypothetical protein D3C77_693540 [compost metagenome]